MSQLPGIPPEDDPSSASWRPPTPAVYQWQPDPTGHPGYLPPPPPPPHHPSGAETRRRDGGLIGGALAGLAAFLKYGVVLLKVGKIAPTLISMVVALFFYTIFFGPAFALGVVLLILVHETGHVVVSRWQGIPMSLPVFLGPFGAFTRIKGPVKTAKQEAIIAIGGPVFGTAAALVTFLWGLATPEGHFHFLLLALAFFGFFINLFNLVPMSPLDGGRVANAISRWMNVVGIVIMAVVAVWLSNPFAFIILILGIITTVQRFRNASRGLEPAQAPPATRAVIGAAWIGMVAACLIGMSLAHTAEINSNFVPGVTQSSGSV
jgi:Zn-dependent protease